MEQLELSVQDIKELIATLGKHGMGKLKLKQGDFSLEIEGGCMQQAAPVMAMPVMAAPPPAIGEDEPQAKGNVVTSPIVGTFYAAPAPDKAPYIQVGSKVKKGDVLFIIESMKLMNEVTSEFDGEVAEILVENAQPVEYGTPILRIE